MLVIKIMLKSSTSRRTNNKDQKFCDGVLTCHETCLLESPVIYAGEYSTRNGVTTV